MVLGAGLVLFVVVLQALDRPGNPVYVPSLLLLGALIGPVTFVAYVYGRARGLTVSAGLLGVVALFGGVVGTVVAGRLEYDTLRDLGVVPMLAVGLIEEAAKLVVPVVLVVLVRSRRPADGLLIGVAAGMGFAALETLGYGFVALLQSRGNIGAVEHLLLLRGILSPAGHAAWTGLTTAALWRTATAGWSASALGRFLATFALAVVLHALWDGLGTLTGYLIVGGVSLALLHRALHATHTVAT